MKAAREEAGCAALPEEEAGCAALPEEEAGCAALPGVELFPEEIKRRMAGGWGYEAQLLSHKETCNNMCY